MPNVVNLAPMTHPSVLQSWKEIAAYLGRGVRTVQRYENEFGLPVRRFDAKGKSAVMALKEDIDRWLRTTSIGPESTESSQSGPLLSEVRQNRFEHRNLTREMHDLRLAHHGAAMKLQFALEKLVGQISPTKALSQN
jgi:hypothetical protein